MGRRKSKNPNDEPCPECRAEPGELCAYSCKDAILTGRDQENESDLDLNNANDWETTP